jgi:hypothetical protein
MNSRTYSSAAVVVAEFTNCGGKIHVDQSLLASVGSTQVIACTLNCIDSDASN